MIRIIFCALWVLQVDLLALHAIRVSGRVGRVRLCWLLVGPWVDINFAFFLSGDRMGRA